MATTTTVAGRIELDGSSIGNVRKQLKEATADLIRMQEQFGATSEEALAAARRVAELRDQIQDAREVADLFDPGKKFAAFSGVINGLAQGFTAVQGAMGLFGVESKELEKQLLRVQSAMALSEGLSGVLDAADKFKGFATIIQTQVVGAFKTLRGAIAATGIGLLVIALGTIVAYWEDIMRLVNGVSKEQENLNKLATDNTKAQNEKLVALEKSDAKLKASGKSEKEILELKKQQSKEVMEAIKLEIERAKITRDTQVAAAKRNNEILKGIIRFSVEGSAMIYRAIVAPLDLLILTVNKVSKALGQGEIISSTINEQITKMTKAASEFVATKVFDPEKTKQQGDDNIKQLEASFLEAENKYYTYQNSLTDMANQGAKDRAEALRKELEEERKAREARLAERKKEEDEIYKTRVYNHKKVEKLDLENYRKVISNLIQHGDKVAAQLQAQADKSMDIARKQFIGEDYFTQEQLRLEQTKLDHKKMATDAVIGLLGAETAAGRAALVIKQVLAAKELLLQIKNTIAFSKLEVAKSQVAVAAGVAQTAKVGFPQNIPLLIAYAAQAVGIISAIKSAVRGAQSAGAGSISVGSPSIGNTGAPLSANLSPQTQLQVQNQQAINQMGNQATRAYILNSDLQNNNQINAYLLRNATIG